MIVIQSHDKKKMVIDFHLASQTHRYFCISKYTNQMKIINIINNKYVKRKINVFIFSQKKFPISPHGRSFRVLHYCSTQSL